MSRMDKDAHQLYSTGELVKRLPVARSRSTIARWMHKGFGTPGGRCVRLKHIRIGSRRYASLADFERFVAELNREEP